MSENFGTNQVGSACQSCPSTGPPGNLPVNNDDEDKKTHWIEIELVDEQDNPVPGEQYRINHPDGVEAYGYLDSKGFARITGIQSPGSCQITFPELDQEAWERA